MARSRRALSRTSVPESLRPTSETSQTNYDRAGRAVESLWCTATLTNESHHCRLHFPSPFMFARRVIDVRSEDLGQHLFPV
jgi:hypothetical protein